MRMTVHGFDGPPVVKLAGIVGGIHLYNERSTLAARAGFRVAALDVSGDRHDDPTKRTLGWDLYADEVVRRSTACPPPAPCSGNIVRQLGRAGDRRATPGARRRAAPVPSPDPLRRRRLNVALLEWAERRGDPDSVAHLLFSVAFLGMTSWEATSPALWVRLPALIRASLDASTPPATVKRKLELLFREEPGLPLRTPPSRSR